MPPIQIPSRLTFEERVELVVDSWCIPAAAEAAKQVGFPLSQEARLAWHTRYMPRFLFAMQTRLRTWEEDGMNVIARAQLFGTRAAQIAREHGHPEVTEEDALAASKELDCDDRPTILAKWCTAFDTKASVRRAAGRTRVGGRSRLASGGRPKAGHHK